MANQPAASQQSASQQSAAPRRVQFVIDRDTIVEAEVIKEHPDNSLDLRGKFGQPNKRWEDKQTTNEVTGEKEIFAEEISVPDPRVSTMTRVRMADMEDVRVGRLTPGTYFSKGDE